jgi:hypothetical protein
LSFYTALYAKGRIKENAIFSPLVGYLCFPIVYLLFKSGCSPLALSWAFLVGAAVLSLAVKPILLNRICDYSWKELLSVYWTCFKVTLVAVPVPLLSYMKLGVNTIWTSIAVAIVSLLSVSVSVWFIGLVSDTRQRLLEAVRSKVGI